MNNVNQTDTDTPQVHGMSNQAVNANDMGGINQGAPQQAYVSPYNPGFQGQMQPPAPVGASPTYVVQQVVPTKRVYPTYMAKTALILGWLQLVGGILSIVFNSVGMGVQSERHRYDSVLNITFYFAHGIWCGMFYILSGGFTIGAARHKSKCMVVSSLVFCIIVAVFCWNQIGTSAASVGIDADDSGYYYEYNYDKWNYLDYGHDAYGQPVPAQDMAPARIKIDNTGSRNASLAMGVLLLILGLMEFVAVIWTSCLACKVLCCTNTTDVPVQYVQTSQTVQYVSNVNGQPQVVMMTGLPTNNVPQGAQGPIIYGMPAQGMIMQQPPPYQYTQGTMNDGEKQNSVPLA